MIRLLIAAAFALPTAAFAAPVTADLSGLRAGGTLYVQLQTRAQFLGQERAAGEIVRTVPAGTLSVALGEIPPGDYALTVWHDDNGNDRFDVGAGGMPQDGLAVSNSAGLRARPAFDEVKFTVGVAPVRVALPLYYAR